MSRTDNILKPIQDALVGILLPDDSIVTDIEIRRRWRYLSFALENVSPTLAEAFERGGEFVHVALRDAPPQDVLP